MDEISQYQEGMDDISHGQEWMDKTSEYWWLLGAQVSVVAALL